MFFSLIGGKEVNENILKKRVCIICITLYRIVAANGKNTRGNVGILLNVRRDEENDVVVNIATIVPKGIIMRSRKRKNNISSSTHGMQQMA